MPSRTAVNETGSIDESPRASRQRTEFAANAIIAATVKVSVRSGDRAWWFRETPSYSRPAEL